METRVPQWSAREISAAVTGGRCSAAHVVECALERVREGDEQLRCFREIWSARARSRARAVDRAVAAGVRLPLAGVPLAVKAWDGLGSVQAKRLLHAGCVPLGASSVPQATSWQTWGHTSRGPTRNPWGLQWSPGGSSAGSAAAVAAGMVPLATGVDGAGSVRLPAAWCGVVGIKPTRGRLPSRDVAALTHGGPLTRTVADAAAYLEVTLGTDLSALGPSSALTAAWSPDLGFAHVDPDPHAVAADAAEQLATAGVLRFRDRPVRLHNPADSWAALRRSPPSDAAQLQRMRSLNDQLLDELFSQVDLLVTPTTPAGPHGHDGPGERVNVELTWAFNLSGHPAASVPIGCDAQGAPVGVQLVAPHGREDRLLQLAATLEQHRPWSLPTATSQATPIGTA